jgi:hypothetical protein
VAGPALGQGTFIYDQQSTTDNSQLTTGVQVYGNNQPVGQSFTPMFPTADFAQMAFQDYFLNIGLTSTVHINVRSDSITGPILASTASITMPADFTNTVFTFFFPPGVTLTPGET